MEGVLEKFCFVIILFLIPLLRWSLLTILREGLLCIIDNRCDLVRHFLICLLCQAVLTKLREENKREEGFKSILKRKLCILAAPYPINLISFFFVFFSRSLCLVVLISIKPGIESVLLENQREAQDFFLQKHWIQSSMSRRPSQWNVWENDIFAKCIQHRFFICFFWNG